MAIGEGRYRSEVPAADQRLVEQAGFGPSNWFGDSHDALPVYPPTFRDALAALNGLDQATPSGNGNGKSPTSFRAAGQG